MNGKHSHPLRPTTRLLVEIQPGGIGLCGSPNSPRFALGFAELLVISELQASECTRIGKVARKIAARAAVSLESVQEFFRRLGYSHRTGRREHAIPVVAVQPSSASASPPIASTGDELYVLKLPLPLRLSDGKFQLIDHDGCLVVELDASEVVAVGEFANPVNLADALDAQRAKLAGDAVTEDRLRAILGKLDGARLLSRVERGNGDIAASTLQASRTLVLRESFARQAAAQDDAESPRREATGLRRPKVIPVWFGEAIPAALGLVFAYAKNHGGGALDEFYDFRLSWVWDDALLESYTAEPAIYLCSNYLWSHERSIAISETVKRLSPHSITIHGGPDTPKYEQDARDYFARFPHVDIIVRGEGEASAAETLDKLRQVIGQENPDLSVLREVAGITYRHGGEIIRNPDRPRIEDLDTIPSPYLMGLFDAYKGAPRLHATLETNRGCPYGCTFCDWGSATTSKIRKFDLDRVFGELEWCANAKVQSVSQADANFGVFERDVAIAQKVAELKKVTGFPETFGGSYAKNSTKYLRKIIKILADAGILAQGVLSLQTMDENTLKVIKRSNIKVEKYDALANEMRNSNLQLSVELMLGLPGATLESFIEDLQQCIDRDMPARINHTTLLVNSPMNHPQYREEHEIETASPLGPGKMPILVSTKTYTRTDLQTMLDIRQVYLLLDVFGVLRLCARFVRQQTGLREMDFYCRLMRDTGTVVAESDWPLLNTLVTSGQHIMGPIYSWALLLRELRDYLVRRLGVPDDSALDALLAAQHATLPAHGRTFPCAVELPHDVVAWHDQMIGAKAAGHWRDWHLVVPPLSSFGPGRLEVDDPEGRVTALLGCDLDMSAGGLNWDMESAISRARVDQTIMAWEPEEISLAG